MENHITVIHQDPTALPGAFTVQGPNFTLAEASSYIICNSF